MDTLTSNVPLVYAIKHDGDIHVYVVIYAGSSPSFNTPGNSGSTKLFPITAGGTPGNTPFFKHYSFDASGFTDIKVSCNGHVKHLLIQDLDEGELPSTSGNQAFEVPYNYTQVQGLHQFKSESAIYAQEEIKFDLNTVSADSNGNTKSELFINPAVTPRTSYTKISTFSVNNVLLSGGSHEVEYAGDPPKKGKTKTKNINHSQTPFPKKRRS